MSIKQHKRIILKCIKNGAELPAYIIVSGADLRVQFMEGVENNVIISVLYV